MIRFASLVAYSLLFPRRPRRPTRRTGRVTTAARLAGDNAGETALGKATVGKLEEKWRFPAKGSDLKIGVVHATPVVVDGYVYFGTVTQPTFYKLAPDGKLKWSYTLAARAAGGLELDRTGTAEGGR